MSSEKSHDKQLVTSGNLLSGLALLVGCIWLLKPIVNSDHSGANQKSLLRAQSLGYQLLEIRQASKSDRSPASADQETLEGEIGKDPWGKPYRYQYLNDQTVLVYSLGENQKVETIIDRAFVSNRSEKFLGDDQGVWITAAQK
jgi:hypothetical protein